MRVILNLNGEGEEMESKARYEVRPRYHHFEQLGGRIVSNLHFEPISRHRLFSRASDSQIQASAKHFDTGIWDTINMAWL